MPIIYAKSAQELRAARALLWIGAVLFLAALALVFVVGLPRDVWTPLNGDELVRAFVVALGAVAAGVFFFGLWIQTEHEEATRFSGQTLVNPASGMISMLVLPGIVGVVLVGRYVVLLLLLAFSGGYIETPGSMEIEFSGSTFMQVTIRTRAGRIEIHSNNEAPSAIVIGPDATERLVRLAVAAIPELERECDEASDGRFRLHLRSEDLGGGGCDRIRDWSSAGRYTRRFLDDLNRVLPEENRVP